MSTDHSILLLQQRPQLWAQVRQWRQQGLRIGLVPTMGNLHQGHLSLVEQAQRHSDRVIVSIFVNPTQFGPSEDFALYPRTLERDIEQLKAFQVDAVFAPSPDEVYPHGHDQTMLLQAPLKLGDTLCGLSRPGHFDGVVTVVSRLFNMIQPDVAVFGEKDYQQLLIIEYMNRELGYPLEILRAPTMRESSGLAMSSRNQYLSDEQRRQATAIHQQLSWCVEQLERGQFVTKADYNALEAQATKALAEAGLAPEYFTIRRADNLHSFDDLPADSQLDVGQPLALRVLVAARMGETRLIDNLPAQLVQSKPA